MTNYSAGSSVSIVNKFLFVYCCKNLLCPVPTLEEGICVWCNVLPNQCTEIVDMMNVRFNWLHFNGDLLTIAAMPRNGDVSI